MKLNQYFQFERLKTSLRVECLAGLTTFLTMSYIVFVNAHILGLAGMNMQAVFVATCLTAAIGSFLVGLLANYPIAVAPGMALNVYFSFVVVQQMGHSWQAALGMTFIAGVLFLLLSLTKMLPYLLQAIPEALHRGLATGIGLFIAIIGLKNAGLVEIQPHFMLNPVFTLQTVIFIFGLVLLLFFEHFRWIGGIILSIFSITLISIFCHLTSFHGFFSLPPSLNATGLELSFHDFFSLDNCSIIFVFFLITVFDATGTFIGFLGGSTDKKLPRALFADSVATIAGSLLGTSSTSPFIESAAGIRAGGRTGLTSIVVAGLFLIALFFSPLAEAIPSFATAPAMLYVGFLMMSPITAINYKKFSEFVPSVLTAVVIPLQFSIADGMAVGVISYCAIKIFSGKWKEIHAGLWILSIIFAVFYFVQSWM